MLIYALISERYTVFVLFKDRKVMELRKGVDNSDGKLMGINSSNES